MKSLCTPLLYLGYLLQFSTAIPAAVPQDAPNAATPGIFSDLVSAISVAHERTAAPSPTADPVDNAHVADIQKFRNRYRCVLYQPTTPELTQTTLRDCNDVCGEAVAKKKAEDKTSAITCVQDLPIKWEDYPGGQMQVSGGTCSCNSEFMIEIAEGFVQALPVITEIGCNLMMTTLNLVMDVGAALIPGVGQAIDGTLIAGIEAAKLAAYAYDAGQAGLDAFTQWANPCGADHLPTDMKKVFDVLNNVDALVLPKGFKPPPKVPKGQPKSPPKADDPPPKDNPPPKADDPPPKKDDPPPKKDDPTPTKTKDQPNTTEPPKSTEQNSAPTRACTRRKLVEREPQAGGPSNNAGSNSECDDDDEPESGPEHVTVIAESEAVEKVITKVCSGALYPQACYNYHSIIENGFLTKAPLNYKKNQFTCSDSYSNRKRAPGIATKAWANAHPNNKWRSYTVAFQWYRSPGEFLAPRCERDEYPPAYFTTVSKEPQRMRWLPGSENGGAGQMWNKFCDLNDGGKGNGQLASDGSVNKDLVSLEKILKKVTDKGKNGKSTTTTSYKAKYTRAVFEMSFDRKWPLDPPENHNWGLDINPCWPKDITPDDPGYVLMIDDDWYSTKASDTAKAMRPLYQRVPTAQELADADARKAARNPPPTSEASDSDRDGTSEDEADPDADSPTKRWIQVLSDGFAAVYVNTSRRITHDEMKREFKSIRCSEPSCWKERKEYGGQPGMLVVPGSKIVAPVKNLDTIATIAPVTPLLHSESRSGTASRGSIFPALPMATAVLSP